MFLLARRLAKAGFKTHLFGYQVSVQSLEAIADRLVKRVEKTLAEDSDDAQPFAIVGHSLGNVIARLASPDLPPGLASLVMIAPPNRSPVTARWLEGNSIFHLLTQDAGRKLADPEFFDSLPNPDLPTLVIAGTAGPSASWLPFEGQTNDGVVALEETQLEGADLLEVSGVHTFLMNRKDVYEAVRDFIVQHQA